MRTIMRRALTPLAVILLAACGGEEKAAGDATAETQPSDRTLAATLQNADGYGALGAAVRNAGLTSVLDGVGPYTVFAPADAAFTAAGTGDFTDPSLRAQSAALLRAHIVPGALTRRDIAAAIERDADGSVQMRSMANTLLTFTRDGEAITVASESGARARLTGAENVATNGVLQPVDALLVRPDAS
ncbi:putative surface protein with fasciclin (FAS1) repeats [Brevundimonas alba]|uniref:Putative surface protein with fasciclin (FAS1) repeats n=1 Tax=Brevundimonas alba TaxID=74314 RepID=A0A7X6BPB4_9CAUL|nr:fasciclin domain-containing protein [Brevundimonas alba]NJC42277.1 putative surface protein with fasciclin (FAS1) repeats [Brevundimonas alba]